MELARRQSDGRAVRDTLTSSTLHVMPSTRKRRIAAISTGIAALAGLLLEASDLLPAAFAPRYMGAVLAVGIVATLLQVVIEMLRGEDEHRPRLGPSTTAKVSRNSSLQVGHLRSRATRGVLVSDGSHAKVDDLDHDPRTS